MARDVTRWKGWGRSGAKRRPPPAFLVIIAIAALKGIRLKSDTQATVGNNCPDPLNFVSFRPFSLQVPAAGHRQAQPARLDNNVKPITGAVYVILAGVISGAGAWPIKLMRRYQFEHWWLVAMALGLIVFPWSITLLFSPQTGAALSTIPWSVFLKANAWAVAWGVANVLCGICYVRIGIGLTTAILSGLGVVMGVVIPLVFKGSGLFHDSPALWSRAGAVLSVGVALALSAIVLLGQAGVGRESQARPGRAGATFPGSLFLALLAGVFSCGYTLSFVYGQDLIMKSFEQYGSANWVAGIAVWGVCLAGGAIVSVSYSIFALARNRSWRVFSESSRDFYLSVIIAVNVVLAVALLGKGMLMMGSLGGAVGGGLQQIAWMLGGQIVGFASGEWRGVSGTPRRQMQATIGLLVIAGAIMVCSNLVGPIFASHSQTAR